MMVTPDGRKMKKKQRENSRETGPLDRAEDL
jgi:hypothetical protein